MPIHITFTDKSRFLLGVTPLLKEAQPRLHPTPESVALVHCFFDRKHEVSDE